MLLAKTKIEEEEKKRWQINIVKLYLIGDYQLNQLKHQYIHYNIGKRTCDFDFSELYQFQEEKCK